jgi:hypothetical protein
LLAAFRIRLIIASAIISLSSLTAAAGCGRTPSQATAQVQRVTIALENTDRQGPAYYWHDSSTYALLYFRPEDFVTRLETLMAAEQGDATIWPALLDNIKVDLPLKETTDLFRYTLIDQRFDSVVNAVIADLMKEGKVMLDKWIFVDDPSKSIVMVSRTDANGDEGGRWFCTSGDDVLFKIGHATFD